MWGELFTDGQPVEIAKVLLVLAGVGFVMLIPFVWVCSKILALKEQPERRALWTIAASYAGAALILIFASGEFITPWFAPLVPLPGAVVVYFWLRYTYRKGWIDDDLVPDGTKLENSDWRVGVGVVVGAIIIAAIKVTLSR
ncbi:MAG: hypothetical protein JY451_14270 [Erythrobacter sp.]|nr:MAG: hypothetical protein JY451_14270 [Erythrobacter sp.]